MTPSKSAASRKPDFRAGPNDTYGRSDALKLKRLAHEEAQKAAGVWGDMSVGLIERNGSAFVHYWKGATPADVYKLAVKRPKEIAKPEHDILCAWLKAGRYEGFKQTIFAWNVSAGEAVRIRLSLIADLAAKGTRVVNA
jgi:hypothetical protein